MHIRHTYAAIRHDHLSSIYSWGDTWLFSRACFETIWKGASFCITFLSLFWTTFFASMLKWPLKRVSCWWNMRLWVYATRHYNHEYRIRILNFALQVRKIRSWKRVESSQWIPFLMLFFYLFEKNRPLVRFSSTFQESLVMVSFIPPCMNEFLRAKNNGFFLAPGSLCHAFSVGSSGNW